MCRWVICCSILVISIAARPPQIPGDNPLAVEAPWNLKRNEKYTLCDFASTSIRRGSREGQIHEETHDPISNSTTFISTQQPCRVRLWLLRIHAHGERPLTMKHQRSGHRCPMTKWQDLSAGLRSCPQVHRWHVKEGWKHSPTVYVINDYGKPLSNRHTGLCKKSSVCQYGGPPPCRRME